MKKEYDFSGAQRGRFFRKGLKLNIPVYLNKETYPFVEELAERKELLTTRSTILARQEERLRSQVKEVQTKLQEDLSPVSPPSP